MLTRIDQMNRRKRRRIITSVHYVFFTFTLLLPLVLSADSYSDPGPQLQFRPHQVIKPSRLMTWFESFFDSNPKSPLDLSLTLRESHSKQKNPPPPPRPPPPSPPTPCSTQYLDQYPAPLQTAPPSAYAPYYGPGYLTKPRDELDPPDALPTQPALVHQPGSPAFRALGKRWAGYATVTVFVNTITVTAGANGNGLQVVTVTVGDTSGQQGGGTVTVTVAGATQTVGAGGNVVVVGPQTTSTQTVFMTPTPTIVHSTSTMTIGVGGSVATGVAKPGSSVQDENNGLPGDRPCQPGEESLRYPGKLAPTNPTQTSTLFAIGVYFVFILVSWNLYIIRQLIYPIKLLVVAWHEFGHVVACACSGARLDSVTIDPNEGGATRMEAQIYPAAGLPAGYLSSFLFGGVMLFCGFDTLASKLSTLCLAVAQKNEIKSWGSVWVIGLMIGFWFIDHAGILRYFVLFVGVMSSWYVLFDVMDDFVFRKMNPCCPVMFEERFPMVKAGIWALIWTILAAVNFVAWILLSLTVWRGTPRGMFCQSQQFLPT
ncbi:uncharacterized protein MELLADRAFT_86772 [Melampsora larici-populina 98AG31]|uniref:Peptidase M50B-like-domain-containing protein n=1 Tax=Melampsora larici-populina (strain 98AG31 / pathotype 3-4-7) TaxID=747676 RepID=F4R3C9_MELLP|nr:uncharacterized protein MELLADRAFT_86772 [Melampsora larici-populina 98AG31]EGG13192.1 hypothetical protein MELLADRAFT_86772 [Melampsora larici-populina 98AG31]